MQQYTIAEQMKQDIKELFASLSGQEISKEELLLISKARINGLSSLTDAGLKTSISNWFIQQAGFHYHIDFAKQDTEQLWK